MEATGVYLNFDPGAYRDAVALVSGYTFGCDDACESLLEGAGHDLACAFTMIAFALVHLLAEREDRLPEEVLETLGVTAARFAVGDGPS